MDKPEQFLLSVIPASEACVNAEIALWEKYRRKTIRTRQGLIAAAAQLYRSHFGGVIQELYGRYDPSPTFWLALATRSITQQFEDARAQGTPVRRRTRPKKK